MIFFLGGGVNYHYFRPFACKNPSCTFFFLFSISKGSKLSNRSIMVILCLNIMLYKVFNEQYYYEAYFQQPKKCDEIMTINTLMKL